MRNSFVYDACAKLSLPEPDIEATARPSYAQCAEDVIVIAVLRALAATEALDLGKERYLEIGANHPVATSATYLLHSELGMTGVLVGANPALLEQSRRGRPYDRIIFAAVAPNNTAETNRLVSNSNESTSPSRELVESLRDGNLGAERVDAVLQVQIKSLLEREFPERPPIYFCIDVAGLDLKIVSDLHLNSWRPAILQVDHSETFEPGSLDAMVAHLAKHGYMLIGRTQVNLIFADSRRIYPRSYQPATSPEVATASCERPSVGIVTRTKDRVVLLRRALESVKNQTYPLWQLVVVNDGGDSRPVDRLIAAVFCGDTRVRVIHHHKSRGMEAASNAGLSLLDTELAIIHDDDDSWVPEFLAVMTASLHERQKTFPSIRAIVCRINIVQETVVGNAITIERVEAWKSSHSDNLDEGFLSIQRMLVRNQFPPIGFLFSLAEGRDLGLFNEALPVLGDWDFHCKFVLAHDVWVHPEHLAFYHHRMTAGGDLGNSVVAGMDKHKTYAQFIRNGLIRGLLHVRPEERIGLVIPMEIQELAQNEAGRLHWRITQLEEQIRSHMIPPGDLAKSWKRNKKDRPEWRQALSRTWLTMRDMVTGRKLR